VECLKAARCQSVLVKLYNQKLPILPQHIPYEPAHIHHPSADTNLWHIGMSYPSDKIWLFALVAGVTRANVIYPMVTLPPLGYGSIHIDNLEFHGTRFMVKIYPLLVHTIKSLKGAIQNTIPKTLGGIKDKV
jgi:hypothetical protein